MQKVKKFRAELIKAAICASLACSHILVRAHKSCKHWRHAWSTETHLVSYSAIFWSMTFFELQNCGYFRKHNQNWPIFVFLTLLCIVLGLCCQIMSRITLFSCQILCFRATFQPREKWLVPQKGFL